MTYRFTDGDGHPVADPNALAGQYIRLNIGLVKSGTVDDCVDLFHAINTVNHQAQLWGFAGVEFDHVATGERFDTAEGDGYADEPTLIVRVHYRSEGGNATPFYDALNQFAFAVCRHLMQDCIAVRVADDLGQQLGGALIGPNAKAWGAFNPDAFVMRRYFQNRGRVAPRYAATR